MAEKFEAMRYRDENVLWSKWLNLFPDAQWVTLGCELMEFTYMDCACTMGSKYHGDSRRSPAPSLIREVIWHSVIASGHEKLTFAMLVLKL